MPELTDVSRAVRIAQALTALRLMTVEGKKKKDALDQVGITEEVFNRWVSEGGDEMLDAVQKAIVEKEQAELIEITMLERRILRRVGDILDKEDDLNKLVNALKHLQATRNTLERKHGVETSQDSAIDHVLAGPRTRVETSQMAVENEFSRSSEQVRLSVNPDGSIGLTLPRQKGEIIDVTES